MRDLPIFITPTGALNVRSGPGIQHQVIDLVRPGDSLIVREPIRRALSKLGTYGEWIAIRTPRGRQGFAAAWFLELQTTDFVLTPTGDRLRVREAPVSGRQIGSVNIGDKLKALDPLEVVLDKLGVRGQWLQVLAPGGVRGWSAAWFLEWHTEQPESPGGDLVYTGEPWQFGRCLQGIHDRADRHPQPADFGIAAGKFEAVKVASGVTVEEVRGYRAKFVLCRLFESWGARALTVDDFLGAVIPDIAPLVQAGITHYEFHNEPNLTGEGLRAHGVNGSWKDGADFARFFIEGRNKLRARFPQIQVGFPGLSPGGDTPYHYGHDSGFRMGHGRFLAGAAPALKQADFVCIHTYYAGWDELNGSTIDLVRKYRRHWPSKLLFVSEFGNGSSGLTGEEKGRQARYFFRLCNQIPGVGGAFYYLVSGRDWKNWALRREDGSSAGIVEAMF